MPRRAVARVDPSGAGRLAAADALAVPTTKGRVMTSDSRASDLLAGLDGIRSWQEDFYRDLHAHPELSHQEHRTAGRVAERMRAAGFDVHERVGGTGVVALLRN